MGLARRRRVTLIGLVVLGSLIAPTAALALPTGFHETIAFSGLDRPTALAFAADGRLYITEQGGAIRLVKKGKLLATPFATVRTSANGERGLLGITLDPNFSSNGYVYVYYTVLASPPFNRVARLTVDPANPDRAQTGSFRPLMDMNRLSSATNHNGGGLHFGPDGKLFVAVGDNANSSNSQTLTNRLGKILRLNRDGSIPTDNPFYAQASGTNRSIWARGLRNPFTFAFDPADGRMNINDVGSSKFEEINRGRRGANYGWPTCEGRCSVAGMTNPLYAYGRNIGSAITGGTFNRGQHFPNVYAGDYFFGDYLKGFIKRLKPNGTVVDFHSTAKSPVDLSVGPNGKLYYLSIFTGRLYRISYGP